MRYDTITYKGKEYTTRIIEHLGMLYTFAQYDLLTKLTDYYNELRDNEAETVDNDIEYYLDSKEWKLSDNELIKLAKI